MDIFKEGVKELEIELKVEGIRLLVDNTDLIKNYDLLRHIFSMKGFRFGHVHTNFELVGPTRIIFKCGLAEFPKCCGKAIVSGFYLDNYLESDNLYGVGPIPKEKADSIFNISMNMVGVFCKQLFYSSLDFIISETEQPKLFSMIRLKPVNSFENHRMGNVHICHSYTMDLNKFGILEEK